MIDHVELSTPQLVDQLGKASKASTVRSLAAELCGRIKLAQDMSSSPMWALAQAHKEIRLIDMISDDIGEEALLGNKLVAAALRNHAEHYITAVLGRAYECLLEALVDAAAPLALGHKGASDGAHIAQMARTPMRVRFATGHLLRANALEETAQKVVSGLQADYGLSLNPFRTTGDLLPTVEEIVKCFRQAPVVTITHDPEDKEGGVIEVAMSLM